MLRLSLLAAFVVPFVPTIAAASPPTLTPMTEVADTAALCKELRGTLDATLTCKAISKVAVKGIGDVEVWSASDNYVTAYVVAINDGSKRWMAERIEVVVSNCGMMKCDIVDSHKPRTPRALKTYTPSVAIEFPLELHHEHTADDGKKGWQVTDDRWSAMQIVTCGKVKGVLTCGAQSWGGRHNSCKVTLDNAGGVTASCTSTDLVPF
jgi:hypothetical protein